MKKVITFTLFSLYLFGISIGQATETLKEKKYLRVSKAYGYLVGQDYSLDRIKKKYPNLEINIKKVQSIFNLTFGNAKENLSKYLKELFGVDGFKSYENKLLSELKKLSGNQKLNQEIAENFILEVENRAKGQIETPILETILSFQFMDNPQDEFLAGFTKTFKTKGHLKAKNTDWQIKVPMSWKAEEADRPNIIQKFTSDYGDGNQSIMITVRDMGFPKGYKMTKEEMDEFFTESEMKNMIPEGSKLLSFKRMIIDKNIGGMVEVEQITERLDYKMKIRTVLFMFIKENKIYSLQGLIRSEKLDTDTDLTLEMEKYLPLYKLVANSIVVIDQYK